MPLRNKLNRAGNMKSAGITEAGGRVAAFHRAMPEWKRGGVVDICQAFYFNEYVVRFLSEGYWQA